MLHQKWKVVKRLWNIPCPCNRQTDIMKRQHSTHVRFVRKANIQKTKGINFMHPVCKFLDITKSSHYVRHLIRHRYYTCVILMLYVFLLLQKCSCHYLCKYPDCCCCTVSLKVLSLIPTFNNFVHVITDK